jgi:hypothetical protein
MTATGRPVAPSASPVNPWGPEFCEIPDLRGFGSAVVQPADASTITASRGPDGFEESDEVAVNETANDKTAAGHAAISQKKTKKHEREARRKAKKAELQQEASEAVETTLKDECVSLQEDTVPAADDDIILDLPKKVDSPRALPLDTVLIETVVETVSSQPADVLELESAVKPSPAPLHVTNNSKHVNWVKFQRQFMVDQLNVPFLPSSVVCSHSDTCVYGSNNVLDCPFHSPRT